MGFDATLESLLKQVMRLMLKGDYHHLNMIFCTDYGACLGTCHALMGSFAWRDAANQRYKFVAAFPSFRPAL